MRTLLLLSAMIWPDLSGINGMASTARLIVYPLGATALPLCGSRTGGRRPAYTEGSPGKRIC